MDLLVRRLVEEYEKSSAGREPTLDHAERTLGFAVEEADAGREDLVEAPVSKVEVFEARDEELGATGIDVRRVSTRRGLYHLLRAVDRGESAPFEALANQRRRNPVSAPDLEHPVARSDIQLLYDASQPLTHSAGPFGYGRPAAGAGASAMST